MPSHAPPEKTDKDTYVPVKTYPLQPFVSDGVMRAAYRVVEHIGEEGDKGKSHDGRPPSLEPAHTVEHVTEDAHLPHRYTEEV